MKYTQMCIVCSSFHLFNLTVCGTTGKRKACKDCSCGLAEELSGETVSENVPVQKSSCGSVSFNIFLAKDSER